MSYLPDDTAQEWILQLGSYTVDQQVSITCGATDSLSGVASSTCQPVQEPAYSFALGVNSVSAPAMDHAGNTGGATANFSVQVTYGSRCRVADGFVANKGIANSLCAKPKNAGAADGRGNVGTKAGQMEAFRNEVAAQRGKALMAEQASLLTRLSQSLG